MNVFSSAAAGLRIFVIETVDCFRRKDPAYNGVNTMNAVHCVEPLKWAVDSYGEPEIFLGDQGRQFSSSESVAKVRGHGVPISINGRGRCLSHAKMDRFRWALKYKNIKAKEYVKLPQLRFGALHYMNFYTSRRIPSALQYQIPDEIHFGTRNRQTAGSGNSKAFTPVFPKKVVRSGGQVQKQFCVSVNRKIGNSDVPCSVREGSSLLNFSGNGLWLRVKSRNSLLWRNRPDICQFMECDQRSKCCSSRETDAERPQRVGDVYGAKALTNLPDLPADLDAVSFMPLLQHTIRGMKTLLE